MSTYVGNTPPEKSPAIRPAEAVEITLTQMRASGTWDIATMNRVIEVIVPLVRSGFHNVNVARADLGAAIVQSLPSDDQIIMDHVREAYVLLGGDLRRFENTPPGGPERGPAEPKS